MPVAEELPIDTDANAMQMAEAMFGQGISISSASYSGASGASGIYSDGDTVAPDITPSDSGVILSTGNATDFTNSSGDVNTSAGTTTQHGLAGDSDLTDIAGQQTFDAAIFEAEFVPDGSTLTMQVTFSSEEYLEYVNSGFNDAVGIWVNGVQAELTVGDGDITINNINDESNANLYLDNAQSDDVYNSEMDGLTVTLTLKADVQPGEVNTIKIGIADGGDAAYDSNLLIAGDSIQTALIAQDDDVTLYGGDPLEVDLLANDSSTAPGTLTITALNGIPVSVGDQVMLPTGEVLTLTENGVVMEDTELDPDGQTLTNTFSYEVTDSAGNTDVAFVDLTTVPCFTAGTIVETESGPVPIEQVRPGMRLMTRDRGACVVRWAGLARRRAQGPDAPIRIASGAFGAQRDVCVSPNHRVLVRDARAALYFDTDEVLIAAKHLLGLPGVTRIEDRRPVGYVHLMFDRHEILATHGLNSESLHPGGQTAAGFRGQWEEIERLFPALGAGGPEAYGPTARPIVKAMEVPVIGRAIGLVPAAGTERSGTRSRPA
jgi:hypothetical protein